MQNSVFPVTKGDITILNLNVKESAPPTAESGNVKQPDSDSSPTTDVKLVVAPRSGGGATCALSDISVNIRCVRSNKTVESYTFLDPGSTGTFCMEELMRDLKVTEKKANILLRTMGKEGTVSTHVVKGLEVSSVDENNFLKLPQVFSKAEIH